MRVASSAEDKYIEIWGHCLTCILSNQTMQAATLSICVYLTTVIVQWLAQAEGAGKFLTR